MQRRLTGQALCRLVRALQGPGSAAEAAPLTPGLQAAARPCCAPAEWSHAPLAGSASTQWQAMRTIWGPRKEPRKEVPAAANPLTSSPVSPGAGAGAGDAGAAGINPLWQTPAEVPEAAPEPDRAGKGKPGEERKGLAILRNIHMSPKKLGLWAKMVRRLHVEDAMIQCTIRVNKGAKILAQVIHSARANAVHNFGLDPSRLVIERAEVGQGSHTKRPWIHGRGRYGMRTKYRSHVWIEVVEGAKKRVTRLVKPLLERPRRNPPPGEAQRYRDMGIRPRPFRRPAL